MVIERKWEHLKALLHEMNPAVLAYSGGVDSSLLLRAASEVMGPGLIAVTAVSETYPAGELQSAKDFARSSGRYPPDPPHGRTRLGRLCPELPGPLLSLQEGVV